MPPIKIQTYDFNLSASENLKSNFVSDRIAKNRWGKKFARLYKRHANIDPDFVGTYDFTQGMRASVSKLSIYEEQLAKTTLLKTKLLENLKVEDGGVWSIAGALKHSYMAILLESIPGGTLSGLEKAEVRGLHFCLSLEGGVGRRDSWFYSSGVNDNTPCVLEPLEHTTDTFGLYLESNNLQSYGHYDGGLRDGTEHNTVLSRYGVEDRGNASFDPNQDALFAEIWGELISYAKLMVEEEVPTTVGLRKSVVVGLNQFLDFIDERIAILTESVDGLINSQTRVSDDLDLIKHLDIGDTLAKEIDNPSKIRSIWFKMEKSVAVKTVTDDKGVEIYDPDYKWWEEEQFKGKTVDGKFEYSIYENVKNFQDYCEVVFTGFSAIVKVKKEVFDLAGHKIYWFVNAFLDVGVKAKKKSWLRRLFDFVLLVIAIVLTWYSRNPVWLKILIVTTQILGYLGVLSPKIQLIVAVISLSYSISNVNFSSLSSMQLFQFAINNIEQIYKMVGMYDAIGAKKELEDRSKEESKNKSLAQLQEETMTFIYTDAYNQYDEFYNVFYDFSPKYLTRPT